MMLMQSSHGCTVGLCFLAEPVNFYFFSIFQKNSIKRVFGLLPYCYFGQSCPMVCYIPRVVVYTVDFLASDNLVS